MGMGLRRRVEFCNSRYIFLTSAHAWARTYTCPYTYIYLNYDCLCNRCGFAVQRISLACFDIPESAMKNSIRSIAYMWNRGVRNIRLLGKGEDWSKFLKVWFFYSNSSMTSCFFIVFYLLSIIGCYSWTCMIGHFQLRTVHYMSPLENIIISVEFLYPGAFWFLYVSQNVPFLWSIASEVKSKLLWFLRFKVLVWILFPNLVVLRNFEFSFRLGLCIYEKILYNLGLFNFEIVYLVWWMTSDGWMLIVYFYIFPIHVLASQHQN